MKYDSTNAKVKENMRNRQIIVKKQNLSKIRVKNVKGKFQFKKSTFIIIKNNGYRQSRGDNFLIYNKNLYSLTNW